MIGRLPPSSDAAAEAANVALVAAEAPDPQGKVALRIGRYMSEARIEVLYYGSATNAYPGPSLDNLRRNRTAFFSWGRGVKMMRSGSGSRNKEEGEGEGKEGGHHN